VDINTESEPTWFEERLHESREELGNSSEDGWVGLTVMNDLEVESKE